MAEDAAPVLIAGAGIAGLSAALALARVGRASLVLERAARLEPIGAGIQLSPNAGHVIAALGLEAAIDRHAFRPEALMIHAGPAGRPVAEIPYTGACARYGAPYRTVHRGDLHAVLLEAAGREPRIALRLGAAVEWLAHEDGAVRVETADGGEVRGPMLVGADGARSAVRGFVAGHGEARFAGAIAWRALTPAVIGGERPVTRLALAPDAHLVAYPMGQGRGTNLVAVLKAPSPDATGERPAADPRLRRHPWHNALAAADDWRPWPLFTVDPRGAMAAGPVVLAGDAGHAVVPFMAQGGAMALEDAAVLADAVRRHGPGPAAAAAFAAARSGRLRRVADASRQTGAIYHLSGLAAFARDRAMALLGPARLIARLDWLYGWRPPPLA